MEEKEILEQQFQILKDRTLDDIIRLVDRFKQDKAAIDAQYNALQAESEKSDDKDDA